MLYKYVKSEPVVRKKKPVSIYPVTRRKPLYVAGIVCFCFGTMSIGYSLYPYAQAAYFNSNSGEGLAKSVLTANSTDDFVPTESSSGEGDTRIYTDNVNKNFANTNKSLQLDPKTHPELANITGTMKLTIPKLGLKKIKVTINVDSFREENYMPVLNGSLAHFKGTSLPDTNGNSFIYGHSTNELWARTNPTNPTFAFTYLNKLDIGDEIFLEHDGKEYKYTLQKTKMVSPDDITPIYSYNEKRTLTLMTCWPPGVGTQRLILIANQE
jgi:LPXTG-site transpeptidase (sortase) family protein